MPITFATDARCRPYAELGWRFGAFTGLYALMQFIFSPILGVLSDRYGRRPILLLSLAGAVVDYLFMAIAPSLSLLFVGRAIAGIGRQHGGDVGLHC
jgi:DHA1 family tetracycline resistance protein-like MFS transporter